MSNTIRRCAKIKRLTCSLKTTKDENIDAHKAIFKSDFF